MKKIAVIGNAGGGKSTLCRALGVALQLPVYAIDKVQWGPGWTRIAESTVDATHAEWMGFLGAFGGTV